MQESATCRRFGWTDIRVDRVIGVLCVALALVVGQVDSAAAADWPQFRGPDGQGHSTERGLPTEWSETENIAWKTPIDGLGWSSPTIRGQQLWITTAIEDEGSLRAICLDTRSGKVIHDVEVFRKKDLGRINNKNSHASPTPVIDGDRIYVHFGAHGTACLSSRGEILWKNEELVYDHRHGPAGSPVLWKDLLIASCDGTDKQFVVAFDTLTGHIKWHTPREGRMAYSTPLVIRVGDTEQVVSPGGDAVAAYDPASGREIWRFRYDGYSVVPRPVYGHGLVYVSSGYDSPIMYAIHPESKGDVTETGAAWTLRRGAPHNPSPLLIGEELYLISDLGVASCVDAKTGDSNWQTRIGGGFSASPLANEGKIYFTNEEGLTTVMAAGKKAQKLFANQVDGRTLASLATSDHAIFLRTDKAVYRIQNPK